LSREGTEGTICGLGAAERTVLLSLLSVGGEGCGGGLLGGREVCWELVGGRGRVSVRGVVDRSYHIVS